MTEIDTAEIRALWSDPLNQAMGGRTVVALCDEIDRLRASLREAERLKEEAGLLYVSAIRDGDIARAKLDTARAEALEEAAKIFDEEQNDAMRQIEENIAYTRRIGKGDDLWSQSNALCRDRARHNEEAAKRIRALASSGGEKGENNG